MENEEVVQRTKAQAAITKLNAQSQKRRKWRWIDIGSGTKIQVPCDKKGNPTEDGLRRIEKWKKTLML